MTLEQPADMQGLGLTDQPETAMEAVSEVARYDVILPTGFVEPEEPTSEQPVVSRRAFGRQVDEVPVITGPNDLEEIVLAGIRAFRNLPETFRLIKKSWTR